MFTGIQGSRSPNRKLAKISIFPGSPREAVEPTQNRRGLRAPLARNFDLQGPRLGVAPGGGLAGGL